MELYRELTIDEALKKGGCFPATFHYNEDKQTWLEPIPESEQDELWKEIFSFSNPPGTDLLKHLISKYHLIKKINK